MCRITVQQRDVISGHLLTPQAQSVLRSVQLARRYSSPLWLNTRYLTDSSIRYRWRRGCSAAHERTWMPTAFFDASSCSLQSMSLNAAALLRAYSRTPGEEQSLQPKSSTHIVPLVNAVFIEETDLFLFLTVHPLSEVELGRLRDRDVHFVYWKGAWESCPSGISGHHWLRQGTPPINAQLAHGRAGSAADTERQCCDHLHYLISPPPLAGADRPEIEADRVWFDTSTVAEYGLALFSDAFWIPFHWQNTPSRCHQELHREGGRCDVSPYTAAAGPLMEVLNGGYYVNTDCLELTRELSMLMEGKEPQ